MPPYGRVSALRVGSDPLIAPSSPFCGARKASRLTRLYLPRAPSAAGRGRPALRVPLRPTRAFALKTRGRGGGNAGAPLRTWHE